MENNITTQPFNNIRKELAIMDEALKYNQLDTESKRNEAVESVEEMITEVREMELEFDVPTSYRDRSQGYSTLTKIVRKGKLKLIISLCKLAAAIKTKQDESALNIISNIKRSGMFQNTAIKVVSW